MSQDTEKELTGLFLSHFSEKNIVLAMLCKLIIGILKLGTISYSKLGKVLNSEAKILSNFRRIQRFISQFTFSKKEYIQMIWRLFVKKNQWVALTIDRTNWKFGKTNINILMLGISYKGTAIPLCWMLLDKQGNSNFEERKRLIDELLGCLNESQKKQIHYLLGDREFIGSQWITYLKSMPFSFIIRIRANTLIRKMGQLLEASASTLFMSKDYKVLHQKRIIWGHSLFIAGQKINEKEWLIFVSDKSLSRGKTLYTERWGIEVFFGSCKKRGFNFEDTHVTKHDRLFNLIFLLAIAFSWAIKTGEWLLETGHTIPLKKLKNKVVKLYSLFRFGFDYLQVKLLHFIALKHEIRLLSCT